MAEIVGTITNLSDFLSKTQVCLSVKPNDPQQQIICLEADRKYYPVQYRDCKAQIAGLLVASEARRLGIDTQSSKLEQIMLQYLSNNDTLLSEDGIKTLNAYALKGYRLITDYPLFDKPTSREEFLDAFNVAMQFYEKKDS